MLGAIQEMTEMAELDRSSSPHIMAMAALAETIIQSMRYNRSVAVGCHPQTHQQTIILLAKPITMVPPLGLLKVRLSKPGRRPVGCYGSMAIVRYRLQVLPSIQLTNLVLQLGLARVS